MKSCHTCTHKIALELYDEGQNALMILETLKLIMSDETLFLTMNQDIVTLHCICILKRMSYSLEGKITS